VKLVRSLQIALAATLLLVPALGGARQADGLSFNSATAQPSAEPLRKPKTSRDDSEKNVTDRGRRSRFIQLNDLVSLRDVEQLRLSPDGNSFVVLLKQADVAANDYAYSWYIGSVSTGALRSAGNGGRLTGADRGKLPNAVWTRDSRAVAFSSIDSQKNQIWLYDLPTNRRVKLAEVADYPRLQSWTTDGSKLVFSMDATAERRRKRFAQGLVTGLNWNDFASLYELIFPGQPSFPALSSNWENWSVGRQSGVIARATSTLLERIDPADQQSGFLQERPTPPSGEAAAVWLQKPFDDRGELPRLRIYARAPSGSVVMCMAEECIGQAFIGAWWSDDEVIYVRRDAGPTRMEYGLYAWQPKDGRHRTIMLSGDGSLRDCQAPIRGRLLCVAETALRPAHIVSIDLLNGASKILADFNPDFQKLEFGPVERIQWQLPVDTAKRGYPSMGSGRIIFPPRFDPSRRYPVFVSPYLSHGFIRGDQGDEWPLLVLAANGFIVLNTEFPNAFGDYATKGTAASMDTAYSEKLGFPHLQMLMDSTLRAMAILTSREYVDRRRIGIGGLSHGAFVPMYMLQKNDSFAAASFGTGGWSGELAYAFTKAGRQQIIGGWEPPRERAFWDKFDLAAHIDAIEAPLLLQLPDNEVFFASIRRLIRGMEDASLPVDAFVFRNEGHIKYQPQHRAAIYQRNLDWFRFWLQDVEDPDPAKAEQFAHWREHRLLQCKNPRSLRDYCGATSKQVPIVQ
jgi:dipeptidyl aminopeptidase/acylaminoacyl peptidase